MLTTAYAQDRKITLTKRALCRSHEHRALTLDQLGKHSEAQADWDHVLELCEASMQHIHRSQKVDSLLRSGQVELAISELEELTKVESSNPNHWVRFARLFAIASDRLLDRKEELQVRSIEMLTRAIALGFKDLANIEDHTELAPLKSRDDFKKLFD